MKKRRKLFCEHGPVCYAISLWKENCKRTLRDWLGRSHFAKNFEEKTLPYVWKGHMSMMLRPLAGVDMQLQRNKVQNLRLAAKQIDGVVVAPGETFSLWALVGRPTRRKGYLDGLVISEGPLRKGSCWRIVPACQFNPLYGFTYADESDRTASPYRRTFSRDAGRRVPFGTGTSIVYKNCDYRFQNTTPYPVQIKVWLQDGMLMGEIRSNEALKERYRLKEENHHYTKETDGYYRNSFVYQVLSDSDGKELQKNLILQNHSKVLFDPALIPQEELRL